MGFHIRMYLIYVIQDYTVQTTHDHKRVLSGYILCEYNVRYA